jgi:signal transduction histidine kinase
MPPDSQTGDAIPLRRVPIDVRALLTSAIAVMQDQARAADIALTLDVAPDVPQMLSVDPDKVAWIITALVGNALRFARRGTRLMPGGTIAVRARAGGPPSTVFIEVQDDGPGIAGDALQRLLQRSPDQVHASGLALSLVRDILAAHGGGLEVESRTPPDASGTVVRLAIPCR